MDNLHKRQPSKAPVHAVVGPPHGPRVGRQLGPGAALAVRGALLLGAAVPAEDCVMLPNTVTIVTSPYLSLQ